MKNDTDQLLKLRHSLAHIMMQALERLYKAKPGVGPAIEGGFYHDFECDEKISDSNLAKVEAEMREIIKENLPIVKSTETFANGKKILKEKGFSYTLELAEGLGKEGEKELTFYTQGKFVNMCKGPHLKSTGEVNPDAFKLTKVAGAYWRGSEKNKMLQRIYGIAFFDKKELDEHLKNLEEAEKRDHRRIGKDLDLFSIDDYVGPGLILWHPKLSIVREEIELYWRKEHRKRGYQYVYTPHIGLDNLWKTSGHLDFFKEGMYPPMAMESKDEKEKTAHFVKPMSCPFHVRIYNSRPRSYRELPIRWCELGSVYRYEESGVLHGMLRVRGLTQDDAHIICREDQFVEEVNKILDFALEMNHIFGFDKLNVYLSVRDPENKAKYVGEERVWQLSERTLEEILKKRKIGYKKDIGGAKFYGPAIDLKAVDAMGREWQGTTIQLDMNLPARFGMTFVNKDGKAETPIMLHRTLLGSMERFVGTLIEQYAGAFPVWLAPVQVVVLPVSDKQMGYAGKVVDELTGYGLRVEFDDDKHLTLSNRIRQAELQKVPYILVVGDKEIEAESVMVRKRGEKKQEAMKVGKFVEMVEEKIVSKSLLL